MTSEPLEQPPEGLPGLDSRALVPAPPARRRPRGESVSRPPMARMMRIHDLIQRGTHPNCTTLAAELEVSDKTVMRDIEFMRDRLQLPIAYNALHRGFAYTGEVNHFPRITVTEGELVALLVAQKALEPYKGTDFEKPLRSALQKMSSGLHESGQFSIQDLQSAISFRPVGLALQELRTFDTLAQAVSTSHVVEFDYFKLKGKKSERRRIEPYHLGCIDNQWYLIGHDLVRAKTRTFALTRLSNPKILKQFFRRPDSFSIEGMMASSFSAFETPKPERVVIRLDPFAARLAAERVWHPSQRLKPAPGGGAVLTLEVGLAPDLENWILGWGSHAKVLEPAALCERIASIARAMALQYSS
jgi:proteasome accessory factor B